MAGRTTIVADKCLRLFRNETPTPFAETWVSLFTTNPTDDHPTAHGAVGWGPGRVRVFPDSGSGSPYWTEPEDSSSEPATKRVIRNVGSLNWDSITLTTTPSTIVGIGIYDDETAGNLLEWDTITSKIVADGEDHSIGTAALEIEAE